MDVRVHSRFGRVLTTLVAVALLTCMPTAAAEAGPPEVVNAIVGINNHVPASGEPIAYGYGAHLWASGDWGDDGPVLSDVGMFVDGQPLDLESIEVFSFDEGEGLWYFAVGGVGFEGLPILGEYTLSVTDRNGTTSPEYVVGLLEDYPHSAPQIVYPPNGEVIADTTPDFVWEPFLSEYDGLMLEPWAYELNFRVPGDEYWVFPIDGSQTSVAFNDPAWEPGPVPELEPGGYSATLHSDHVIPPGGFHFEHHVDIVFEVSLNEPPVCDGASPSQGSLWPPNHKYREITIVGPTDPDGDSLTIIIDGIYQDEAVDAPGSGNTAPDARGIGTSVAEVRAERTGGGDGRVYHIYFTADDSMGASCSGEVLVGVPHDRKDTAVDGGALFDSTLTP